MEADLFENDAQRTSPLLLGAAVVVLIFIAIGIGAVSGVIPGSPWHEEPRLAFQIALPAGAPSAKPCFTCGTITSIRAFELRTAPGSKEEDLGKEAATTILSAAGSIFASEEFQTSMRKRYAYRVTLRMEDGSYRTLSQRTPPKFSVGEKVRLLDGTLAAGS
jgi:hypothetical protein